MNSELRSDLTVFAHPGFWISVLVQFVVLGAGSVVIWLENAG
jgi:hypothetical protein